MDLSFLEKCESYFAAANGYLGFVRYFDELFDPKALRRLYILKGGPGTGKSSLMKKIAFATHESADRIELIYCASDKNSLDGIVVHINGEKYAVIDGTPPHSTEPIFPGAVDEIINLGELWNDSDIIKFRQEIELLNFEKSKAYESAYKYLGICGKISEATYGYLTDFGIPDHFPIVDRLHSLSKFEKTKTRVLTSFGKGGFFKMNTLNIRAKNKISIVGVYGSEYIVMNAISRELKTKGISHLHCPSALDPKNTYALYIDEIDTLFICGELEDILADETVDSSRYFEKSLSENKHRLEFLARERESFQ